MLVIDDVSFLAEQLIRFDGKSPASSVEEIGLVLLWRLMTDSRAIGVAIVIIVLVGVVGLEERFGEVLLESIWLVLRYGDRIVIVTDKASFSGLIDMTDLLTVGEADGACERNIVIFTNKEVGNVEAELESALVEAGAIDGDERQNQCESKQ